MAEKGYGYFVGVAVRRLVYGVIDYFPKNMVQALYARRPDIHTGNCRILFLNLSNQRYSFLFQKSFSFKNSLEKPENYETYYMHDCCTIPKEALFFIGSYDGGAELYRRFKGGNFRIFFACLCKT